MPKTEAHTSELSTTGLVDLSWLGDVSVRHSWKGKLQEMILLVISKWELLSRNWSLGAESGSWENYSDKNQALSCGRQGSGRGGTDSKGSVVRLAGWLNSGHTFPHPGSWFRGSAQSIRATRHMPSLWNPPGDPLG